MRFLLPISLIAAVAFVAFGLDAASQRTDSPLTGANPIVDELVGAHIGEPLDGGMLVGNTSTRTVALKRITFSHGVSSHLRLVHTAATPSSSSGDADALLDWPPKAADIPASSLKPVDGYRLAPGEYAVVIAGFKATAPGVYYVLGPTTHAVRTDFWKDVPVVRQDWTATNEKGWQSFCVDVPDRLCSAARDIVHRRFENSHVLSMRFFLTQIKSGSQSGYLLVELPGGKSTKLWFTIRNGRGDLVSHGMTVHPGWQMSVGGGFRCPASTPSGAEANMHVWTMRPDGTDREPWPQSPPAQLPAGEFNGLAYLGDGAPSSGETVLQINTRCSWSVYAFSRTGPLSL